MEVSQRNWKSWTGSATSAASGCTLQKILYRALLVAVAAGASFFAAGAWGQEERPQIMPGERKVPRKKDVGPRALGLLRLGADGKTSLVPIAILVNGKFWDATAYKASPIPMALESGTVYEVERGGNSLGLFTVSSALHSIAVNAPTPWIATGKWLPTGTETTKTTLKAEAAPVGIDTSDQPPRLTRNPQPQAPPASTTPASAPASGPSSGDEPPRLTKPAPPASTTPAPSAPPAESKPGEAKAADHSKEPAKEPDTNSGATDANRPRLRRGKPTEPLPDEDVPGYAKLDAVSSGSTAKSAVTPPASAPSSVQLIPAISDADGPEPRSFAFEWLKDEEGERRQQMTALAKQELRAYVDAQAKARIPAQTTKSHAQRRGASSSSPEPVLENVRMAAYDLWNNNQPVLVFSAETHLPPPPAGTPGALEQLQYSIMIVAYPDIYNNLHKLYVGVTDKYHLDVTPRLELIDAADADGDGRGELLFREISDLGSGWVIYRATADTLWKMFDSLNPE
jgi:hypothetical protein